MVNLNSNLRKGCKDIWNSYMAVGADFSRSNNDIPFCPTTATKIPSEVVTWEEAKANGNDHIRLISVDDLFDPTLSMI